MNVIFSNLDLILAALAILITVAVLARRGQIGLIRELVLSLVVNAEKEYGAKTGPIKKSDVTAKIYSMLPTASKLSSRAAPFPTSLKRRRNGWTKPFRKTRRNK